MLFPSFSNIISSNATNGNLLHLLSIPSSSFDSSLSFLVSVRAFMNFLWKSRHHHLHILYIVYNACWPQIQDDTLLAMPTHTDCWWRDMIYCGEGWSMKKLPGVPSWPKCHTQEKIEGKYGNDQIPHIFLWTYSSTKVTHRGRAEGMYLKYAKPWRYILIKHSPVSPVISSLDLFQLSCYELNWICDFLYRMIRGSYLPDTNSIIY